MKAIKVAAILGFASFVLSAPVVPVRAQGFDGSRSGGTTWPMPEWTKRAPASVGLDEKVLAALDADLGKGKSSLVDSFTVVRCRTDVFERTYSHDYGAIYGKEAKTRGPLNAHLTGPYNYSARRGTLTITEPG